MPVIVGFSEELGPSSDPSVRASQIRSARQGAAAAALADDAEGVIARKHTAAMRVVINKAKGRLQDDIAGSGIRNARAISKVWRSKVYPDRAASMTPAGIIYVKRDQARNVGVNMIEALTYGVTIVAHTGRYVSVPTGPARQVIRQLNLQIRKSVRVSSLGRGARGTYAALDGYMLRVAEALGIEKLEVRWFGNGQLGLVVGPGVRLKGRLGPGRSQRRTGDTPLFWLTKQARIGRHFRGLELFEEIKSSFGADFAAEVAGDFGSVK